MTHKSTVRYYSKKFQRRRPDPKNIETVIQNSSVNKIIKKAQQIERTNSIVLNALPIKLSLHCEVMNIENGVLTICVDDPVWITALRYEEQALLHKLRQKANLLQVNVITYKIRQH